MSPSLKSVIVLTKIYIIPCLHTDSSIHYQKLYLMIYVEFRILSVITDKTANQPLFISYNCILLWSATGKSTGISETSSQWKSGTKEYARHSFEGCDGLFVIESRIYIGISIPQVMPPVNRGFRLIFLDERMTILYNKVERIR